MRGETASNVEYPLAFVFLLIACLFGPSQSLFFLLYAENAQAVFLIFCAKIPTYFKGLFLLLLSEKCRILGKGSNPTALI